LKGLNIKPGGTFKPEDLMSTYRPPHWKKPKRAIYKNHNIFRAFAALLILMVFLSLKETANPWGVEARENLKKLNNLARPEELRQAEGNLKRQMAAADLLKKNIRDSYVIAPVDGIMVKKFVEKGEMVSNFTSLCRISNLKVVDLIIYIPETELGKIKQGSRSDVTVDSFPDKKFRGEVIYISPEAEFTPKNIQTKDERTKLVFAVKVRINNPELELKAGMPADAVVYF
jgi:HlyD family secretion protein